MKNILYSDHARKYVGWIVGAGLLISIVWLTRADPVPSTLPAEPAVTVTTVIAKHQKFARQLIFFGPIVGRQETPVYADLPQGRISTIHAEEGERVKAGALLATVDTALLEVKKSQQRANLQRARAAIALQETQLQEVQAQYAQTLSERQRGETLGKTGFISREVSDQRITAERVAKVHVQSVRNSLKIVQADKAQADAQMAETELHLNRASIRAPVAGTIIERRAKVGLALAQFADPLFVINANDALEVELEVSAEDAAKLTIGMAASIQVGKEPMAYAGKVRRVAGHIRRQDQTARVRIAFQRSPRVIPGQFAQVTLIAPSRNAIYLPEKSIRFEGTQASIFTVRDGLAVRLPIHVGEHSNGLVEVLGGVADGLPIIDSFTAFLRDREPVKVVASAALGVAKIPPPQPFQLGHDRNPRLDSAAPKAGQP